jgi:Tfp pilus assembly protein PilF
MIVQYKVILAYNHPAFSIEALSRSFHVLLDQPLFLLRSTNFFRLMSFDNVEWDYLDGMYLLIFPLAQFICVIGVLFLFKGSMKGGPVLKKIAQPKNLVLTGIFSSIALVTLVLNVAPDKSIQEIKKRVTYKQLLSSGDFFLTKRDYNSAQVSFDQASLLMPDLWTPYFMKATIFVIQKEFKLAEQEYSKAIEIFPDHPSILANYGATLGVLGESKKAVPFLKAAIRQLPNNYSAYNSLAQVYLSQQKPKKARDMLLLAITVNPAFGKGHANLAKVYVIMNDREKARIHLKKALGLGFRNSKTENLKKILKNSIKKN